MKKKKQTHSEIGRTGISYLLLLVITCTSINAQKIEGQNYLLGTWTFDSTSLKNYMENESKQRLDSLPNVKAVFKEAYEGRKETFMPNGEHLTTLTDGRNTKSKWALDESGILLISYVDGFVQRYRISVLTEKEIVLVPINTGDTRPFMTELHFFKN